MLSSADWQALLLTLQLAACSTVLLLLFGLPLAWWMSHQPRRWMAPLEALLALPLVLPPTVLGFYLLVALGPKGPIGSLAASAGLGPLVFSFSGLLIGSCIYSLPFALQPLLDGFRALGRRPLEVAATLGAGPLDQFFNVALPLSRNALLTAALLSFAHTLGEFGVVLMIGGNIPGETRLLSIAIYDAVESLDFAQAHRLSLLLFGLAALLMLGLMLLRRGDRAASARSR